MEFTGKNLDQAIEKAENETNISRNKFTYEIIKTKKNIFGKKKVTINITKFLKDSMVSIKNGKLEFLDGDLPVQLTFNDKIIMEINGTKVNKTAYVKANDNISITILNEIPFRNTYIEIKPDNMQAILNIQYKIGKIYTLKECNYTNKLNIEFNEIADNYPEKYAIEDIKKIIIKNNLRYGIQTEEITKVINNGGRCIIALGTKPIEPIDDKVLIYFDEENKKKPEEFLNMVDYYNIKEILYVEKNEVLVEIIKGTDGKDGTDVFGNKINVRNKIIKNLSSGSGTRFFETNKIISTIKGIPVIKNNIVCVFPVLKYDGDVDLKTGNIIFDGGDLIIKGNVKEGIKINAGSSVNIYGEVANACINAGANIRIYKNVISSSLAAGIVGINEIEALEYLKQHYSYLQEMIEDYEEIKSTNKININVCESKIFKVLLESQLKKYKQWFQENINKLNRNKINDDIRKNCNDIDKLFLMIDEELLDDSRILYSTTNKLHEFIQNQNMDAVPGSIYASYCQNSKLDATSNIEITGKGSYNSDLRAFKDIKFTGYPGIVRGGHIIAGDAIYIKEIGSRGGVMTTIKTSKEGNISADIVYQNTLIFVGNMVDRIDNPCRNLKAYILKGELIVEKLKL